MHMDFQTIILRFRDLVTEENGTIKRHQDVIAQNGYVWWAWWKKGNETTPVPEFSSLATNAKTAPVNLFLVDSGQGLVYRAKCEDVDLRAAQKIPSPETDKTPEYYRDQEYYAWFKFTQIEQCDESDLKQFSYVDCPALFENKNIDYSKFNHKKIYSAAELIQQNRTVWFIRPATEDDLENEIILLNSEMIQPAWFSRQYFQTYGDTLIWLSDLHLSERNYESKEGAIRKTLGAQIYECIRKNSNKRIGGVLISGDITSYAKPEGFDLAKQLMKDLNNELPAPVSSENILLCPGNHDFARATIDLPRSMAPDFIYNKSEHTVTYSEFYKSIYNIAPNRYFATGRKLLLSSGHMLEIAALNSVILQQYPNFEGHGYLTQEQLDFVAKEMKWDDEENQNAIRIVMMHHHYLPTCYAEAIDATRSSSVVYDADRLMSWLVKYQVKLLLHGHKHKTFVSQVNYPKRRDANINSECMHCVAVVGMGSTGESGVQNKFATIRFERDDVLIDFYNIYSDESSEGHLCQSMRLSLK